MPCFVAFLCSNTISQRLTRTKLTLLPLSFFFFQEIYREIVSNSRAVAACVRAYEKKSAKASRSSSGTISGFGSLTSSSTNTTGEPSGSGSLTPEVVEASSASASYYRKNGSGDGSGRSVAADVAVKLGKSKDNTVVKGLERRYHLLYLKAIEIQCLLEGLLENRTSVSVLLRQLPFYV